jgi:uncharacterized repeat protein (TIGR01451 family)
MSLTLRAFLLAIVLAFAPCLLLGQPDRIPENLDPRDLVTIRGNVNPRAKAQFDQGPADLSLRLDRITLMLKPATDQQAALEMLLRDQQDPASPNYRAWLTPEQYADRFGLSPADIDKIVVWLQSQSLSVDEVARGRNWIAFSGGVAQVQAALRTGIHRYNVAGELHFANSNEPSIPRALASAVIGILGLDDFYPKPLTRQLRSQRAHPDFTSGSSHYLAPDDLATIYDLAPLYSAGNFGDGQTIAIMGQSDILMSDISAFRAMFNLSATLPTEVLVGHTDPGMTSDMQEADLDLEWAGAVARNANLIYVYSVNVFNAVTHTVNQNLAPIISYSFGDCEPGTSLSGAQSQQLVAQQANAQGITWVTASGDAGAAGCNSQTDTIATQGFAVNLPAGIPEVTGVGGTVFNEGSGTFWGSTNGANSGSALSYIPEQGWNDTSIGPTLAASGGGTSIYFSKPAWQTGPGVPSDGARDVPDLALTASADHDGYILCNNGSCASGNPSTVVAANSVVGGTSASTPVFSGILAVLQKYQLDHGFQSTPGLGNINPTLYQLAQNAANIFHDVTVGNNVVPCTVGTTDCTTGSFGYAAGPGYDLVTGLGSVDAGSLVTSWHMSQCAYALPGATTVSSHVSAFSLSIGTQSGCPWTAWTSATWISINPSTGTGSGNTNLSLATNNTTQPRSATVFVGGQIFTLTQDPSIAPDLVITSLTAPTTAVIGGQIAATVVVNNLGSIAAPAFRVEFYFSASPTISTNAIDTGSGCSFAGLAVSVPTPCSIPVAVRSSLTPGTWYLGAIADPTNQVVEQDKSNNARAADSGPVTLTTVPSLSITKSHTGNFSQGQQGANYVVTVSNAGSAAPTSGTVTVTETLPSGLTLVSMAGSGWACASFACTRGDALGPGMNYPAITVTVNVSATATSPQVNQVSVSGGGSATASASDSTILNSTVPSPSLSIHKTHSGNFTQGQQNAVYSVAVSNAANAGPTGGTVMVTETLPSELTLVSMAGSGWACASFACTRGDALGPGMNYPAITVTVNVTATATSPQVNQVSVSGGGSATGNASDSTMITATVAPPSLSIHKTHSGNFTQGQQNAVYGVMVSNAANVGPTSGIVTVTETLPSGLTLVSMAGSGWACASFACTRGDALGPGMNYPAITVTVNVTATATSPQVNQVSVSGGGSATASASDSTIIVSQAAMSLSPGTLKFGYSGQQITGTQTVALSFNPSAAISWTASSSQSNVTVSPTSGAGNAVLQVTAAPGASSVITVTASGTANSPQQIQVNVTSVTPAPPFGSFDTPANNTTGVAGAIPVTGWALDNIEATNVGIWREPVVGETAQSNGLVFIGDAVFVSGARPDVQATFPNSPFNYRAGWGYMLLTNFLANASGWGASGNGTYKLHALITNASGETLDLGAHAITVDNEHAAKPFGTIDTPAQGGTVSGNAYVNFGWALTQNPYVIPTNGSTITVILDGVPVGHPTYNQFRSDIANLFPGLANSNGAVGFFFIDTTTLTNGVHTISWNVFDNAGRGDGIGSRYFTVANTGTGSNVPATDEPIEPGQITADATGVSSVSIEELDRIELPVGATNGYLLMKDERRPLPVGSTLKGGRFYWQAGPGFLGDYNLLFEKADSTPIRVHVSIKPKSSR